MNNKSHALPKICDACFASTEVVYYASADKRGHLDNLICPQEESIPSSNNLACSSKNQQCFSQLDNWDEQVDGPMQAISMNFSAQTSHLGLTEPTNSGRAPTTTILETNTTKNNINDIAFEVLEEDTTTNRSINSEKQDDFHSAKSSSTSTAPKKHLGLQLRCKILTVHLRKQQH